MSLPVILRNAARTDFDEAFDWYERQRPGLGEQFEDEVNRTLDRIAATPESYPIVHKQLHRAIVSRFPYLVFYRVGNDRIEVYAIFHARRDPAAWHERG